MIAAYDKLFRGFYARFESMRSGGVDRFEREIPSDRFLQ
jgi:hypothetical protein